MIFEDAIRSLGPFVIELGRHFFGFHTEFLDDVRFRQSIAPVYYLRPPVAGAEELIGRVHAEARLPFEAGFFGTTIFRSRQAVVPYGPSEGYHDFFR